MKGVSFQLLTGSTIFVRRNQPGDMVRGSFWHSARTGRSLMRLRSALVPLFLGAAAVVGACGPSGGGNGNDDGDDDGDDDGTPDAGGDDDTRPDARVRADAGPP